MLHKAAIKRAVRPFACAAWPAVEAFSRFNAGRSAGPIRVVWFKSWNDTLDAALATLPELKGCPHQVYRALTQETDVPKRHALVTEDGLPIAVISLRRCNGHWEPVAYQCLPDAIAPALDTDALGRALHALGIEICIFSGVGDHAPLLEPALIYDYPWYKIDLQDDYEAYWRAKGRASTIRKARKRCANMEIRIGGAGDLDWIVEAWRAQWQDDPGSEVVAAQDRLNFWQALRADQSEASYRVHTVQLLDGGRRVSGIVHVGMGDTLQFQCGGRDPAYEDSASASGAIIASIEWAKSAGYQTLDLAGGDYKRWWGPEGGRRHGVTIRPAMLDAFSRLGALDPAPLLPAEPRNVQQDILLRTLMTTGLVTMLQGCRAAQDFAAALP